MKTTPALAPALLLAGVFLCQCQTPKTANPFHPEKALLARSTRLLHTGDHAAAEKLLRKTIFRHPDCVLAHREYQNLLEAQFRHHEALATYSSHLSREPRCAAFHYLRGRLAGEEDAQLRYFRRAAELDPDLFWSQYGIAFVLYKKHDFPAARTHLLRAIRLDPLSPMPHLMLGDIRAASYDFDGARRHWSHAALLDPTDPWLVYRNAHFLLLEGRFGRALDLLLDLIPHHGDSPTLGRLLARLLRRMDSVSAYHRVFEATGRYLRDHKRAACIALRGIAAQGLGHLPRAREQYDQALEAGANPMLLLNDYRLLLVTMGEYRRAWDLWKRKLPEKRVFQKANRSWPLYQRLFAAIEAAAKAPQNGEALLSLGQALKSAGWMKEALAVLGRAARLKGGEKARTELRTVERHLGFVRRLADLFDRCYLSFMLKKKFPDLTAILSMVGKISREELGEDLGRNNTVEDFSLIGRYVDPSRPDQSPLVRYFRRYNQHFVLGQRQGRPPEATLMTMAYHNPAEPLDGLEAEAVFGENFQIRSFSEFNGRRLLGLALFHGFYLNLDALTEKEFANWALFLRYAREPGDLVHFKSFPVQPGEDILTVGQGRGLKELLLLRAYGEVLGRKGLGDLDSFKPHTLPPGCRLLLGGTFAHEAMHVKDARRFLPLHSHPIAALGLALREGFSGAAIEAHMEYRAGLAALAKGSSPLAEMASLVTFLPYPLEQPPHSRGFVALVKDILRYVATHPETYKDEKGLDFTQNLFRQIHRLSNEQVRSIAVAMALESGLFHEPAAAGKGEGK